MAELKQLSEETIALFWSDMDALGHLNNVTYFRYMEEVRVRWLSAAGFDFTSSDTGPVLYDAQCTYMKPMVYPASLRIVLLAEPPRRSSVNLFYHFYSSSEVMVAKASSKIVWVDYQRMKSISLPDSLQQRLS